MSSFLLMTDLPICSVILVEHNFGNEEQRKVDRHNGEMLAKKYGIQFFETNSSGEANLTVAVKATLKVFLKTKNKKVVDFDLDRVPDEIENQPYELDLYEKALLDGKEKDCSVRVNIVGNYNQGKTSLTRRLLNQSISGVKSTNGIDVQHYICSQSSGGKLVYKKVKKYKNEDIVNRLKKVIIPNEKENPLSLSSAIFETEATSSDEVFLPFTNTRSSDHEVDEDIDQTDFSVRPSKVKFGAVVIEDKVTSPKQKENNDSDKMPLLKSKEKKAIVKALKNCKTWEQVGKQKTYFDFWDFGGQYIFYATHSLFHSRKAIYILVFDLTQPLQTKVVEEDYPEQSCERTVEYFLRFWLNSIHSLVGTKTGDEPVVILVGTHKDKLKTKDKELEIQNYFDEVRRLFDGTAAQNHIFPENFAVDNTSGNDNAIAVLRETILYIGSNSSQNVDIPAKWIQLEQKLKELKARKIITFQRVLDSDSKNEIPLGSIEQVKLFLQHHHRKGNLFYFDEKPLSDYVILDPQFLIDAFKSIITSKQFCSKNKTVRRLWDLMVKEARLERDLVDHQWENNPSFKENKQILMGFLEKHHIITEAREYDESTHRCIGLGWYIVPSLLRTMSTNSDIQELLSGKQHTLLQLVLVFEEPTLMPLVFHRLLAAVVGKWPVVKYAISSNQTLMIFQDACIVELNSHLGMIKLNSCTIRLAVFGLCPSQSVDCEITDGFRRFCEFVIQHEFGKLMPRAEGHDLPYDIKFTCNHFSHGGTGSEKYVEIARGKIVHCPDLKSHDIVADRATSEWYADTSILPVYSTIILTEQLMSKLAQSIGDNWELLGIELGLTDIQIDHLKADHHTTAMRIYKMLLAWKSHNESVTLYDIAEAIRRTPTVKVDWDTLRNIADGIE